MQYKMTIKFDTDNTEVPISIRGLIENTLPYMADNVEINVETVLEELSDLDELIDSYIRAVELADGGSITASNEVESIITAVEELGYTKTWLDIKAGQVKAKSLRRAVIRDHADKLETVRRYLPSNYSADSDGKDIWITGNDSAGWTLDGYVIPRLASGLYRAEEVKL